MATRPDNLMEEATWVIRTVEAGQTVAVGRVVKDGSTDHKCQHTTDGVQAIGVVQALGPLLGVAGDKVKVALFGPVTPVKVGTGGATRGKFAKVVSDGVTDAAETVTTPVAADIVGQFTQSGVVGDVIGMVMFRTWVTE